MGVKDRLIEYIKYKRISRRQFALQIGASPAFVGGISKGIGPDYLDKIAQEFPDLNTSWLRSGEGSMLNGQTATAQEPAPASDIVQVSADVWEVIKNQTASLQIKDAQMDRLITQIEQMNARYDRLLERAVSVVPAGVRDSQNPPPLRNESK